MGPKGAFVDGLVDWLKADVQGQADRFLFLRAQGLVHGLAREGKDVSRRKIAFHPIIFRWAQLGRNATRSAAFSDWDDSILVRAPQDAEAAMFPWTVANGKPTGPGVCRALDQGEILVRRGRNHGLVPGHHPGDVPGMDKSVRTEKLSIEGEKTGMMRESVQHFDALGVIVSGDADSNIQPHFVLRNRIDGREINPTSMTALIGLTPSVALHHFEHQSPKCEHLISG